MHPIDEIISLAEEAIASGSKKAAKPILARAEFVKRSELTDPYQIIKAGEVISYALEAASARGENSEHWLGVYKQVAYTFVNLKNK